MPANEPIKSKCTVGLLSIATQAAYRIKKDNLIDPTFSEEYAKSLRDIAEHGYAITKTIAPIVSGGTGETPLAAICLEPQDNKSPIIISFRGTKTAGDVISDLRLGTTGVVEQKFRDAAFDFYQKIRKDNPNREIVLSGHSLGGHLAQYVATKAYDLDGDLQSKPLLQVRTFNTAPIDTIYSRVFDKLPGILPQFVNYRTSSDIVSDLPLKEYYGNTFVFKSSAGSLASHGMGAITKYLPAEISEQAVGESGESSKKHNILVEQVNGLLHSYQCRVDGQFFSKYRAGVKNLTEMEEVLPGVLDKIKDGNYKDAKADLDKLSEKLDGIVSKNIIDVLKKSTDVVEKEKNVQNQQQLKASLNDLRQEVGKPKDEEEHNQSVQHT